MDFIINPLADGQRLKAFTIVDDFTKKSVEISIHQGMQEHYAVRVLGDILRFRGMATAIRTDKGPEFANRALDQWAYRHGVTLKFIRPGKHAQTGYNESHKAKFRDERPHEQ